MFENMTYREITLQLLLIRFLTIAEVIDKRIAFKNELLIFSKN